MKKNRLVTYCCTLPSSGWCRECDRYIYLPYVHCNVKLALTTEMKCHSWHFLVPLGQSVTHFCQNNPAVTHFALIVPLPARRVPLACFSWIWQWYTATIYINFTTLCYMAGLCNTLKTKPGRGLSLLNPWGWPGRWNSFHCVETGLTTPLGKDWPYIIFKIVLGWMIRRAFPWCYVKEKEEDCMSSTVKCVKSNLCCNL